MLFTKPLLFKWQLKTTLCLLRQFQFIVIISNIAIAVTGSCLLLRLIKLLFLLYIKVLSDYRYVCNSLVTAWI